MGQAGSGQVCEDESFRRSAERAAQLCSEQQGADIGPFWKLPQRACAGCALQLHANRAKPAERLHFSKLHKLPAGADAGEDRAAAAVRAQPLHLIVCMASIINYDSLE